MNGGLILPEMDYTIRIKHLYRGHHYILPNVLLLNAVQVTYIMDLSSPFMGDPAPTVNRHMTIAFEGRHADSCNALPEVCKLNPANYLLS
jgi:hypothetical protein